MAETARKIDYEKAEFNFNEEATTQDHDFLEKEYNKLINLIQDHLEEHRPR